MEEQEAREIMDGRIRAGGLIDGIKLGLNDEVVQRLAEFAAKFLRDDGRCYCRQPYPNEKAPCFSCEAEEVFADYEARKKEVGE